MQHPVPVEIRPLSKNYSFTTSAVHRQEWGLAVLCASLLMVTQVLDVERATGRQQMVLSRDRVVIYALAFTTIHTFK